MIEMCIRYVGRCQNTKTEDESFPVVYAYNIRVFETDSAARAFEVLSDGWYWYTSSSHLPYRRFIDGGYAVSSAIEILTPYNAEQHGPIEFRS